MKYFILGLAGQPVLWTLLVSRTDIHDTTEDILPRDLDPPKYRLASKTRTVLVLESLHLTLLTAACLGIVRLEI